MTSRYVSIRADNVPSNGIISFKAGFPILSFTIQSQQGILDPKSIRIAGNLQVFKDNNSPPTPVYNTDAENARVTMDNRLGIYNIMDQVVIRHNTSKQICEHIRHYPRYLSSYLGLGSSKQDLTGHLGETCLIMPDPDVFFRSVIANDDGVTADQVKKSFSAHLPTGMTMSMNPINLMESSFGGIQIEIHLSPDANCLFNPTGVITNIAEAHYRLTDLELTCEIADIPSDQVAQMSKQTSGQYEFNTITSLYTSINSTNAQLQYSLGLKSVQSVFLNFCPSSHINTLTQNGMATTYPSKSDKSLAHFKRVQWLRGGVKYPCEYDIVTNIDKDANTVVVDPQVLKSFIDSVIPEYLTDRSSVSNQNNYRGYNLGVADEKSYLDVRDGGALFGIGQEYSQFNTGQDFSREQWGLSLETDLTDDSPQSVFIFIKARSVLAWNQNGVQLIQ
tara:strand:+ start:169 stop:1509 length:1341 start_codon:yes stop_codon:yes gene_type:complete